MKRFLRFWAAAVARPRRSAGWCRLAVVDEVSNLLVAVRMDGAKFLSMTTATHKAMSAAS